MADLERVRQGLYVLSDDPMAAPERTASPDDDGVSPPAPAPPATQPGGETDEPDTSPLPVILPGTKPAPLPEPVRFAGGTPIPRPGPVDSPRGPFEPARPPAKEPEPAEDLPPGAAEKLDQIKDLMLTAEAIGEENLDRHFEEVSRRQRQLIREFFDRAVPKRDPRP